MKLVLVLHKEPPCNESFCFLKIHMMLLSYIVHCLSIIMQFEKKQLSATMKYIALKFQNGNKALKMNDIPVICISRLLRLPDNFFVLHRVKMQKSCIFVYSW